MKTIAAAALAALFLFSNQAKNTDNYLTITMGSDMANKALAMKSLFRDMRLLESSFDNKIVSMEINSDLIGELAHLAHDFGRCGGFIVHDDEKSAQIELFNDSARSIAKNINTNIYEINQAEKVKTLIQEVEQVKIRKTIEKLSSYKNRYYKSNTGVQSQLWLMEEWKKIGSTRSDITVERFRHNSWPQDSIIATIQGSSSEVIVLGGHGDSVAGWFSRSHSHAPGADDNASGIATMTEVLRILAQSGHRPEKTIKFISYAAEEVGLRGSKEIAEDFKNRGVDVLGVLQLDMTNFKGTADWDIVLMSDYTNDAQNKFIGQLIDTYLPGVKWGYDRCGYACSDHASWTAEGYPASMPFEAKKNESNRHIHSSRDTLSQSNDNAEHAAKFARMALAYAIELDR